MKRYRCKECGTGFSTTGNDVPPSPTWADGHVCVMSEVESKLQPCQAHSVDSEEEEKKHLLWEEHEKRMKIIGQNGNDGIHYGEEGDFNG